MSNHPVLASSRGLGLTRVERRAAKEIALTRASSSVLAARESAKADAIASVTETVLLNAYDVTCLECALVARTPAFAGRGAYIGDKATTAMASVLTGMSRSL
jgi:hypothetical protein